MTTARTVTERLRAMAAASVAERSPMPDRVDMSPSGVTARLREMADVSRLCDRLVAIGRATLGAAAQSVASSADETTSPVKKQR